MLVRVMALLILLMAAFYCLFSFYKYITRQQWKTAGKITFKIALAGIFAVCVVSFLAGLSQLTN